MGGGRSAGLSLEECLTGKGRRERCRPFRWLSSPTLNQKIRTDSDQCHELDLVSGPRRGFGSRALLEWWGELGDKTRTSP